MSSKIVKQSDNATELPPEIGALIQWQAEVLAGVRRRTDIDALSRAAIHEAHAREEWQFSIAVARQSRLKAADLIIAAVAESAA